MEFEGFNEQFYVAFLDSFKNVMIVGKNFDIKTFKLHEIFDEWFENHANKHHPYIPDLKYRKQKLIEGLKR